MAQWANPRMLLRLRNVARSGAAGSTKQNAFTTVPLALESGVEASCSAADVRPSVCVLGHCAAAAWQKQALPFGPFSLFAVGSLTNLGARLRPFAKFFNIPRYIESLEAFMKH
jgi:hypothetical protein